MARVPRPRICRPAALLLVLPLYLAGCSDTALEPELLGDACGVGGTRFEGSVPGGTWTPAGNPHRLVGDVRVRDTLVLRPGVVV